MSASLEGDATRKVARQTSAERITVALIPKASEDLERLQDRTGLAKTDIVNRAISLYEFINAQLGEGNELLVRMPETGDTHRILLL